MRHVRIEELDKIKEFALRAAKCFENDSRMYSFTDGDIEPGCLFASNYGGMFNDCVLIIKLCDDFEPLVLDQIIHPDKSFFEKSKESLEDEDQIKVDKKDLQLILHSTCILCNVGKKNTEQEFHNCNNCLCRNVRIKYLKEKEKENDTTTINAADML